jgi:hypothetical protein
MQYIATKRVGKKNIGIAGINLGNESCLASAQKAFSDFGISYNNVDWGNYISGLKNYKKDALFIEIDNVEASEWNKKDRLEIKAKLIAKTSVV